jgi:AcrR family transcriptional regulator
MGWSVRHAAIVGLQIRFNDRRIQHMMNTAIRRTGRRSGNTATRDAILVAAREVFADESYADASLRKIAARAGVDVALIAHYFGSKNGLFEAAIALPFNPRELGERVFGPGVEGAGARLARAVFDMWESEAYGRQLRGLVRAAVSDAGAARRLGAFIQAEMLPLPGDLLAIDRSRHRMALAGSHLVGTAFARYILRVEPLASIPTEDLVNSMGPVIQHYLTGDLASPVDTEEQQ